MTAPYRPLTDVEYERIARMLERSERAMNVGKCSMASSLR